MPSGVHKLVGDNSRWSSGDRREQISSDNGVPASVGVPASFGVSDSKFLVDGYTEPGNSSFAQDFGGYKYIVHPLFGF